MPGSGTGPAGKVRVAVDVALAQRVRGVGQHVCTAVGNGGQRAELRDHPEAVPGFNEIEMLKLPATLAGGSAAPVPWKSE